jgi:hypothetical protein
MLPSAAGVGGRRQGQTGLSGTYDTGLATMAHRIAHLADKAHLDSRTLERINSAVIFGLIGGGLFACVLGALVYDISRAVSDW